MVPSAITFFMSAVAVLDLQEQNVIPMVEDRFHAAKRVAMALYHLDRTQYPGRHLRHWCCSTMFGRKKALGQLRALHGWYYYTNTRREGMRMRSDTSAQPTNCAKS